MHHEVRPRGMILIIGEKIFTVEIMLITFKMSFILCAHAILATEISITF